QPYQYTWPGGETDATVTGLDVEIYDVVTADFNGCTDTIPVTISEAGGPVLTVDTVMDVACGQSDGAIYINVAGGLTPYAYAWSTGATTEDITGLTFGRYKVTVTGANGCRASLCDIVVKALPVPLPIGFVTVDSITEKNMIMWRNIDTTQISHYKLYRESSQQDVYYLLAEVPYDSLITFFDTLSKPEQHSWKYKISVVDLCGRESFLSRGHRTMHLKTKKHDDYVRLSWNHYEGFGYDEFYIYRSVEPQPYILLDSVLITENHYIDSFPPVGTLNYVLEVIDTASVNDSSKAVGTNYNSSRSNVDGIIIIEVAVNEPAFPGILHVEVYPNPNTGEFTLAIELREEHDVTVEITDMLGKVVYRKQIKGIQGKNSTLFTLSSNGVYTIRVKAGENIINKRVVVRGKK
ncbi:MAG: T9SS type A sorting domain-containing protein, partial [Bacteroidetes bacterium]|nr:T9SS type A sorting domain-containing protein [Bacteroidota bacterium]